MTIRALDWDDPTSVPRPLGAVPFFVAYLIPASAILGIVRGGGWVWSTAVLVFVLTPVLDVLLGNNRRNPERVAKGPLPRRDLVFDFALWLWVPTQLLIVVWGIHRATTSAQTWWEVAGLAISVGLSSGGGGINVAHELMHRIGRIERAMGEVLMTLACYPHFSIEHVRGHHRTVATPDDPASARFGESLYAFLPRTLSGSLRSAWRIETERVQRGGRATRGLADRRLRYPVVMLIAIILLERFAGWQGVAFFLAQGAVAVLLLETINYIEHYGLERRLADSGRYEPVGPRHSWNASQRLTNWYLFNLQRHADHHEYASRPYWLLRHVPESPQLPAGYATMCLLAAVPPLWRRVMDPRVRNVS